MIHIDVYRVQRGKAWWHRKWQCEWDGADRAWRAYTEAGCLRRGTRKANKQIRGLVRDLRSIRDELDRRMAATERR